MATDRQVMLNAPFTLFIGADDKPVQVRIRTIAASAEWLEHEAKVVALDKEAATTYQGGEPDAARTARAAYTAALVDAIADYDESLSPEQVGECCTGEQLVSIFEELVRRTDPFAFSARSKMDLLKVLPQLAKLPPVSDTPKLKSS